MKKSVFMWCLNVTGPIVPCLLSDTQDFQKRKRNKPPECS